MPGIKPMRSSKGFSLIELIFAMFFLSIIVLGVVNLQSSNLALMNRQNNEVQAHFIANEGVQILKTFDFQKIKDHHKQCQNANINPCLKYIGNNNLSDRKEEPIQNLFDRIIEIKTDPLLPNAIEALVYVEWEDTTGSHRKWLNNKEVNKHVEAKIILF